MRSHGSEPGADSPAPTRTDGHGGDARFGQDRGEQESVGADGDESSSVRDNDDFAGNIGRRTSNSGQGGSHGLLGRGGEASIGGMGGYGREGGRGMFDDPRGESAGGQRDAGQIQPGASDDSHAGRARGAFTARTFC